MFCKRKIIERHYYYFSREQEGSNSNSYSTLSISIISLVVAALSLTAAVYTVYYNFLRNSVEIYASVERIGMTDFIKFIGSENTSKKNILSLTGAIRLNILNNGNKTVAIAAVVPVITFIHPSDYSRPDDLLQNKSCLHEHNDRIYPYIYPLKRTGAPVEPYTVKPNDIITKEIKLSSENMEFDQPDPFFIRGSADNIGLEYCLHLAIRLIYTGSEPREVLMPVYMVHMVKKDDTLDMGPIYMAHPGPDLKLIANNHWWGSLQ